MTGGDDSLVKVWDTKTAKVIFTLDSHIGKDVLDIESPSKISKLQRPLLVCYCSS